MLILISDANVLIDLEVGGIIERIFRLKATIAVPDVLFDEELAERHARLVTLGLQLRTVDAASMQRVAVWMTRYPQPSFLDLMAFALAVQLGGTLLTGDGKLRKAIEAERERSDGTPIDMHGTVWLLGRMLDEGVITDAEVHVAVTRMKSGKCRLPWDLVDEMMHRRSRKTSG